MSGKPGSGALDLEQQALALALMRGGMKQHEVAAQFGVTKNVVAGVWARWGAVPGAPPNARSASIAPQSASQQALADRISGAPQPLAQSGPIVAPASPAAQKRITSASTIKLHKLPTFWRSLVTPNSRTRKRNTNNITRI